MSPAQQRALDLLLPRLGVPFAPSALDFEQLFLRRAPTILEIGFGMGETTAEIARTRPAENFLGVEVHGPGVGGLLKRVDELGLTNVRVIRHDAVEVLEQMVGDASLAAIHLFFPDPWPKKRHHKRRLVQAELAALMARKLAPGGSLHAATDWPDYAEQMAAVFGAEPLLEPSERGFAARPVTKFESRGQRLGHPIRDLHFRRRQTAPAAR